MTLKGAMPGLLRRYPRSMYLALLAADDSTGRLQAPSAGLVAEMMRAFPQNVLVLHEAIRGLILDKKYAEASALFEQGSRRASRRQTVAGAHRRRRRRLRSINRAPRVGRFSSCVCPSHSQGGPQHRPHR